jgi:hypothetical protein
VRSGIIKYHFLDYHVLAGLIAKENLDGAIETITSSSSLMNDAFNICILNAQLFLYESALLVFAMLKLLAFSL